MLNFEELDHEFMTEGNPDAEAEKMAGLIKQNLTPEEQERLKEMMPILEEYNMLMVKVQTGNTVEELDNLGALEALGVPSREELGTDTPQEGQMQQRPPPQAAQEQVPQNAPEMPQEMPTMALGGVPPVIQENVEPTGNPGDVAAGPVGLVNDPGADNSGVGDDVPAKSDGFVINAAAVKHAGLKDVNEMIQSAKEYAEQKGIKLNFGKTPTGAEDILVSNGEVVVPDALANIIGYDKLEKINNRGKKETEEKLAAQEEGASPEGPPTETAALPPVLQDQMAGLT